MTAEILTDLQKMQHLLFELCEVKKELQYTMERLKGLSPFSESEEGLEEWVIDVVEGNPVRNRKNGGTK